MQKSLPLDDAYVWKYINVSVNCDKSLNLTAREERKNETLLEGDI